MPPAWPWPPWVLEKTRLDNVCVHVNSRNVRLIKPFLEKILPLFETRFPGCFRRRPGRPRRMEIQLEFPWISKR